MLDCFKNPFSTDTGTPENIIPLLISSVMERQFLLAVHFIFPVLFLSPQQSALFMTYLLTLLHQYLLDLSIMTKNNKLEREGDITGLLDATAQGVFLMQIYASR